MAARRPRPRRWFVRRRRFLDGARPFSFLTVLPPLGNQHIFWRQTRLQRAATDGAISWDDANAAIARYDGLAGVSCYAPYARTAADLLQRGDVRRSDTHEVVSGIKYQRLSEVLYDYYRHPEWKSGDPHGVGVLPRRHVRILRHIATGKESNRVALAAAEETDGVVGGDVAGMDGAQVFDTGNVSDLSEWLQRGSVADLVRATGLSRRTIYDLRNGKTKAPTAETLAVLVRGLALVDDTNVLPAAP